MDITSVQCIVKPGHRIPPRLGDFLHFRQLVCAPSCEVKERQLVEIFRLLVCPFDDLWVNEVESISDEIQCVSGKAVYFVVALLECLLG